MMKNSKINQETSMRTLETIDAEIAELKGKLDSVRGTETEVYTRIVGYYRSLRNWNKGKREEYSFRLPFAPTAQRLESDGTPVRAGSDKKEIAAYRYFYRKACPNCPPVRDYVAGLPLEGTNVDVDTAEGMDQAVTYQILSTPTVLFFDRDGRPLHQANSIPQMEGFFGPHPGE
jgi:ribonucleoside-triphosphate reductase